MVAARNLSCSCPLVFAVTMCVLLLENSALATHLHRPLKNRALHVMCHLKQIAKLSMMQTPTHILGKIKERHESVLHSVGMVKHYLDQISVIIALRSGTPAGEMSATVTVKIQQLCAEANGAVEYALKAVPTVMTRAEMAARQVMRHAAETAGKPQTRATEATGLQRVLDWHCRSTVRVSDAYRCVSCEGAGRPSEVGDKLTVDCSQLVPDVSYKTLDSAKMKSVLAEWTTVRPPPSETRSKGCRSRETNGYLCVELEMWVVPFRQLIEDMTSLENALHEVNSAAVWIEQQWTLMHYIYTEVETDRDWDSILRGVDAKRQEYEAAEANAKKHGLAYHQGTLRNNSATGLRHGEEQEGESEDELDGESSTDPPVGSQDRKKVAFWIMVSAVSLGVFLCTLTVLLLCAWRRSQGRESVVDEGEVVKESAQP